MSAGIFVLICHLGRGTDITDFNEAEGDKATGNCEDVGKRKGNGKNK